MTEPADGDLLVAEDVRKEFGGLVAVNDVSFTVPRGRVISLIGPNGAGKTTFFNMLTGVYKPTAGSITFLGENVTGKPPHADHVARHGPNIPEHPPLPEHDGARERAGGDAHAYARQPLQLDPPHAVREAGGGGCPRRERSSFSRRSACGARRLRLRRTCRTASSGSSRSRARSRPSRNCCCSTSRPQA